MQFNSLQFLIFSYSRFDLLCNTEKNQVYMAFMCQLLLLCVLERKICISDFIFNGSYMVWRHSYRVC